MRTLPSLSNNLINFGDHFESIFFFFLLKKFYRGNNKNSNDKETFLMKNNIKQFDQKKNFTGKKIFEGKNFVMLIKKFLP